MSNDKYRRNIFPIATAPFNNMASHEMADCIERLVPEDFPVAIAIHRVTVKGGPNTNAYVAPHMHEDEDEVNIIISKTELVYGFDIDDEHHEVTAPAAVWLPAGLNHAANAISGSGFFICVKIKNSANSKLHSYGYFL